ncbi:MAG: hypothetical protein GXO83_03565 [Chlorobi bacterium]|nr:hypothetical protein [Chlorobiota bacterium]
MLEFLRKWFSGNVRHSGNTKASTEPTLDLGPAVSHTRPRRPDADVHRLMIQATGIRREKGYTEAVHFLKDLAGIYLQQENTALVTCINKLIPYMKKDTEETYSSTYDYLVDILRKIPAADPYFLNLHITMAELIEVKNRREAIAYLENFLREHPPSADTYYHLIKLGDFYGNEGEMHKAREYLQRAKTFWDTGINRSLLIRMQRRWFRSAANIAARGKSRKEQSDYLTYRFLEFAMDMARVLDPAQIGDFHKRKDQYFNKVRGFEEQESFLCALDFLGIQDKKAEVLGKVYGFVFEEMPVIMGVTETQLRYHPGQPESLEEVRQKKIFAEKPFTELDQIEQHIQQLINRYTL